MSEMAIFRQLLKSPVLPEKLGDEVPDLLAPPSMIWGWSKEIGT